MFDTHTLRETYIAKKKKRTKSPDSRWLFSEKESESCFQLDCAWKDVVSCHVGHVTYQQDTVSQWLLSAGVTLTHTHKHKHNSQTALADNTSNNREFQLSSITINKICITLIKGGFILSVVDILVPSQNGLLELNHSWQPSQNLMYIHEEFTSFLLPETEQLIKACFFSNTKKGKQ